MHLFHASSNFSQVQHGHLLDHHLPGFITHYLHRFFLSHHLLWFITRPLHQVLFFILSDCHLHQLVFGQYFYMFLIWVLHGFLFRFELLSQLKYQENFFRTSHASSSDLGVRVRVRVRETNLEISIKLLFQSCILFLQLFESCLTTANIQTLVKIIVMKLNAKQQLAINLFFLSLMKLKIKKPLTRELI